MKLKEAIKRADIFRPNALGDEQKAAWLHDLDGQLAEFFGKTAPENQFPQVDVELLTPPPYDEIYVLWLACKIDYYHQEMDLYANDSAIYEQALAEMRAWWRRGHVPACSAKWEGL